MQDFQELQQAKAVCLKDITEALPRYTERLAAIDQRLVEYVEDAVSGNASHANIYELLGIRKTLRLMDSYDMDVPRVHRTLRAIEGVWQGGRHQKGGLIASHKIDCVFGLLDACWCFDLSESQVSE